MSMVWTDSLHVVQGLLADPGLSMATRRGATTMGTILVRPKPLIWPSFRFSPMFRHRLTPCRTI